MASRGFLFSGEPLPLVPDRSDDPELAAFHRKLIDYLRRLTSKLQNATFDFEGALDTFLAVLSTDQVISSHPTYAGITWDTVIRSDDSYTFTEGGSLLTVNQDGFYVVFVDLEVTRTVNTDLDSWVVSALGNKLSYSHMRTSDDDGEHTIVVPMSLRAANRFEIQAKKITGVVEMQLEGCRFAVVRVNDFGGVGGGTGDEDLWDAVPP